MWFDTGLHDQYQPDNKLDKIGKEMNEPTDSIDSRVLDRIQGSIIGLALGDALGAPVEFRPHQYFARQPVTNLRGGGTWGLRIGQASHFLILISMKKVSTISEENLFIK